MSRAGYVEITEGQGNQRNTNKIELYNQKWEGFWKGSELIKTTMNVTTL